VAIDLAPEIYLKVRRIISISTICVDIFAIFGKPQSIDKRGAKAYHTGNKWTFSLKCKLTLQRRGMTTGELLQQVEGLTKDLLYYFESKGYIKPRKVYYARVERNDYSEDDLRKVQLIWHYYSQGFRSRVAYEKAMADYNSGQLSLWEHERS
jgi:hypothetical protein